jgi:hypothetical protein
VNFLELSRIRHCSGDIRILGKVSYVVVERENLDCGHGVEDGPRSSLAACGRELLLRQSMRYVYVPEIPEVAVE